MNVATKITLVIFSIIIILVSVAGYSIYTFTRSALETSISENQLEFTRETMARIDRVMYERFLDIQGFANSVIIEKFILGIATKEEVNEGLTNFFETSGPWDIVKIVGVDGKVIFSSNEALIGKRVEGNKEANTAYEKSLAGEVYVSDVVVSSDTGYPTIFFSAPIREQSAIGRPVVGIVIGQFSWSTIEEILVSSRIKSSSVYLFSENGQLIASSKHIQNASQMNGKLNVLLGVEPSNKLTINGIESLVSRVPQLGYLGYKGSNWNLVIETPVDIVFDSAYRNAFQVILITFPIIIVAAFFLIFTILKLFVSPLKKLTVVAKAIAEGDLKRRVDVTTHDEIGELGQAFNTMTDKLLETQAGIEKKVEERTKELEEANSVFTGRELKMMELKKEIEKLQKQLK